ncbi:MAG: hypothetical protein ACYDHT_07935 [Solirubrobacteraceae bacterium]
MRSSKIRTAAVTLLATAGLACASAMPAVSQAKPINPYRNVATKQATKKQVVNSHCSELLEMLNESLRELDKAHREGNEQGVKTQREQANNEYLTGYENGCGFAA